MPVGTAVCWPKRWTTSVVTRSGEFYANITSACSDGAVGVSAPTPNSGRKRRHRRPLPQSPAERTGAVCDKKPSIQIQAVERAQGWLRLPHGQVVNGFSHRYKRHGTTTLFAALDVATGQVTAAHYSRRRDRIEHEFASRARAIRTASSGRNCLASCAGLRSNGILVADSLLN